MPDLANLSAWPKGVVNFADPGAEKIHGEMHSATVIGVQSGQDHLFVPAVTLTIFRDCRGGVEFTHADARDINV
jgi:hypothetical protein